MRNLHKYILTAVCLFGFMAATSTPTFAQSDTEHADVNVQPDEVVLVVSGIVCSFCAQGVTKKLSKLPFIDQSKYTKGIKVEIGIQRVTIATKPDAEIDFDLIFSSVKDGGYEPIKAYTANGDVIVPAEKMEEEE